MGKPVTTKTNGICFAFPDVCKTPAPPSPTPVPIPYPNIGELKDADPAATNVKAGGHFVIHERSEIPSTKGDEAGTGGAVQPGTGPTKGRVTFTSYSSSVKVNSYRVVRMFDTTKQNNGNAVGTVLAGVPTVLAGG